VPAITASKLTKITGVCPAAHPHALAQLVRTNPAPVWLVLHEEAAQADALAEDIALFHSASGNPAALEILIFPEAQPDKRELRDSFNAASDRLAVLSKLRALRQTTDHGPQTIMAILATPSALLQPVPAVTDFAARESTLQRGTSRPFKGLLELLHAYDYDSEAVCEAPGQYAVRGGIVDVYPITAHQPYRLDFFGDTLEDIRSLDRSPSVQAKPWPPSRSPPRRADTPASRPPACSIT